MVIEAEGLFGREREVATIRRFLATVEERPAALVLEGEPGIGKTVLLGHAVDAARRRGYQILMTRPTSAESGLSFVGLTDLLLDARGLFAELPAPQRRALEIALLLDEPGFAFLNGHIVLSRWNFDVLERAISDLCSRTEGSDWREVATKLSRYGSWEFEDYSKAG